MEGGQSWLMWELHHPRGPEIECAIREQIYCVIMTRLRERIIRRDAGKMVPEKTASTSNGQAELCKAELSVHGWHYNNVVGNNTKLLL